MFSRGFQKRGFSSQKAERDAGARESALVKALEKRDGVAEHGVIGARMIDRSVYLAPDSGHGLEQELAEIAKCVGGAVRDAFFGESVEDFAEDVIDVGHGIELAGEGGKFLSQLVGCKELLFLGSVEDTARAIAFFT